MPDTILIKDGIFETPLRLPRNLHQGADNSIHNDVVAKPLGFRGGTVAGSIHLDQYPPLMLKVFGTEWFETGNLSLYFRNATTDKEPVRAFSKEVEGEKKDAQVETWMKKDDGLLVADGTASIGRPEALSAIRIRMGKVPPAKELRMLEGLKPGKKTERTKVRVTLEETKERLPVMTEVLDWYTGKSPWGGPVASPYLAFGVLYQGVAGPLPKGVAGSVSLFGGIELAMHKGPVFLDHEYERQAEILHVSESPKTEYFWFESKIYEPGSDYALASMIMQLRFMKASSKLWQ